MAAYRCSRCSLDWPVQATYRTCPVCAQQTWSNASATAMAPPEANGVRLRAEFDRYYDTETDEARARRERKYAAENALREI